MVRFSTLFKGGVHGSKHYLKQIKLYSLAFMMLLGMFTMPVLADTKPASGTPATVSADPLPTVQVDGMVWDQVVVGNKVYAAGYFSTARPAGVPKGGAGTVTRQNILAYDLTTGELDTAFVHSLTGAPNNHAAQSIAASPDGTKLYVGGSFTSADGQARNHFAAFDLTTNKLLPGFSGPNGTVWAVTATNSRVYIGGQFSQAAGQARSSVAAYTSDGNLDSAWKADVTGRAGSYVRALVAVEPYGNLLIGGTFSKINGSTYYSTGAVKLTTGKNVKWASQSKDYAITMQAPDAAKPTDLSITSMSFAGNQAYFTAFTYIQNIKHPKTFEGRAAINPSNGKIIWADACKGDTYDAVPIGDVLYSVGHAHNCSAIGQFSDQNLLQLPPTRALAETTKRSSTKKNGIYTSTLLNWFPSLEPANVSGAWQAAWSVVGNSQYIALGGEFTKANGKPQQGLVRYTIASNAPNKVGPEGFPISGYGVAASAADSKGKSTVRVYNASDQDNSKLTYELYRSGSSTLLASKTVDSRWWKASSWTYTDTGIKPGTSLTYTVVIKDPYGNTKTVTDSTLINDDDKRVKYSSGWSNSNSRSNAYPDFNRDIHRATKNGSSVTMTFIGASVALFAEKSPNMGKATVSIDGGAPVEIDMYADLKSGHSYYQAQVFSQSGLSAGTHTIKIVKTSGKYLTIDAFKVR